MTVITTSQARGLVKRATMVSEKETRDIFTDSFIANGLKNFNKDKKMLNASAELANKNNPRLIIQRPPVYFLKGGYNSVYASFGKYEKPFPTVYFESILFDKNKNPYNPKTRSMDYKTYRIGELSSHAIESIFQRLHTTEGDAVLKEFKDNGFLNYIFNASSMESFIRRCGFIKGNLSLGITTKNGLLIGSFIDNSANFIGITWIHKSGLNTQGARNAYIKKIMDFIDESSLKFFGSLCFIIPEDLRELPNRNTVYLFAPKDNTLPKKEIKYYRDVGCYYSGICHARVDLDNPLYVEKIMPILHYPHFNISYESVDKNKVTDSFLENNKEYRDVGFY